MCRKQSQFTGWIIVVGPTESDLLNDNNVSIVKRTLPCNCIIMR